MTDLTLYRNIGIFPDKGDDLRMVVGNQQTASNEKIINAGFHRQCYNLFQGFQGIFIRIDKDNKFLSTRGGILQ